MPKERRTELIPDASLTAPRRRGGVLVGVLVVLFLVGMLSSQTMQTLLLLRRGDSERKQLRQARELLELGQLWRNQSPGPLPQGEQLIALDDAGSVLGKMVFEPLSKGEVKATKRYRIVVEYPSGTGSEVTVTWESGR
ncbi:MAG: hypothetical protein KDA45_00595 [Planctomycetales bacterium]|nr:hypothetical protein [Planctomycetales bacterium]